MSGKFKLYSGPMKSGKSAAMVLDLNQYKSKNKLAVGIKPPKNTRDEEIGSRDQVQPNFKTLKVASLAEIEPLELSKYDAIGIDELFMFDKNEPLQILRCLKSGIDVYATTLNVLANGEISETNIRAMMLGPTIVGLTANCEYCDQDATFSSARKDGEIVFPENEVNVEGEQNSPEYSVACIDHFDPQLEKLPNLLKE